jgi:hypothetical protein
LKLATSLLGRSASGLAASVGSFLAGRLAHRDEHHCPSRTRTPTGPSHWQGGPWSPSPADSGPTSPGLQAANVPVTVSRTQRDRDGANPGWATATSSSRLGPSLKAGLDTRSLRLTFRAGGASHASGRHWHEPTARARAANFRQRACPPSAPVRLGVRLVRFISTRPKSRTMRATRQLLLPPK